jgi:hypothetical protein
MTDIYIYVAAPGVDLDDRDSLGHTRPNLHAIEHNQTESRLPYGIASTANPPAQTAELLGVEESNSCQ